MKNLFSSLLFFFVVMAAIGQPTTGTTVYGKVPQSSIIFELPFNEAIIVTALQEKMNAYKVSPKKIKDFYVYRSVVVPEISSRPINLYFNIDKKSRKEKNAATLSMLIADDKDVFLNGNKETDFFRRGKDFVGSLEAIAKQTQHNADVAELENEMEKVAKKIKQLENEQDDLKKKIKKMEEALVKSEKDLKEENENLAAQKKQLEILKTQ